MTLKPITVTLLVLFSTLAFSAGPIHDAVRAEDLAKVREILERDPASVNAKDDRGRTPLHFASYRKNREILSLLLAKGADVAAQDANGYQPLHWAVIAGQVEAVTLLLEAHADPNAAGYQRSTPFDLAISESRTAIIDAMLASQGTGVETRGEAGRRYLHRAAARGLEKLVEWMLAHGADAASRNDEGGLLIHSECRGGLAIQVERQLAAGINVNLPDGAGRTPLYLAVSSGRQALVDLLLARGASLDAICADGRNLLHAAAAGNLPGFAERLVKAGRSVNGADHYGRTPFYDAVQAGATIETVKWLLANGANPDVQDWWGVSPAYYAALNARIDILEELFKSGARLDMPMWDGDTPLLGAFSASRPDGVFWLLRHGARLDARNGAGETILSRAAAHGFRDLLEKLWAEAEQKGLTRILSEYPLHRAASHGQTAIAEFLLAKGVKADLRDERGKTPLHRAAQGGSVDVGRVLLEKGVDIDARDEGGTTPLHDAVKRGKSEMVRRLLERKADTNARDGGNRSPLALAAIYGYPEIAGILTAAGAKDPGASTPPSIPKLLAAPLRSGEAQVWFLGHCGFAVRTKTRLLIFDYVRRAQRPQTESLANGFINPEELKGLDVTVFVSHNHADHYDPAIFEWEETVGSIRYVFGWKEREGPRITTVADRRASARLGNMEVHVVNANHNLIPEVAYLVKVDGLAIFHSGDYGAMPADLADDMAYLRKRAGQRIDLAFLGMYGVIAPVLKPAVAFPMHMGWLDYAHEGAARAIERLAAGTRAIACDNEGDRYSYRSGTIRWNFVEPLSVIQID